MLAFSCFYPHWAGIGMAKLLPPFRFLQVPIACGIAREIWIEGTKLTHYLMAKKRLISIILLYGGKRHHKIALLSKPVDTQPTGTTGRKLKRREM